MLLFCLNQLLEQSQIFIWPLYTHLDDLLCLPVSLSIILAAEKVYFRNPGFTLPLRYTVLALVLFSVVFEVLLPSVSGKYTADVLDVAAYTIGAALFHFGINGPVKHADKNALAAKK